MGRLCSYLWNKVKSINLNITNKKGFIANIQKCNIFAISILANSLGAIYIISYLRPKKLSLFFHSIHEPISELTQFIFHIELTHLGSEASIYIFHSVFQSPTIKEIRSCSNMTFVHLIIEDKKKSNYKNSYENENLIYIPLR